MWLLCVSRVAGVHVVIVCQPGGWSCKAHFFPMLMEADSSLIIISTQMKAEDPLRNLCYVVMLWCPEQCVRRFFSSHSEVFSLEVVWAHHL